MNMHVNKPVYKPTVSEGNIDKKALTFVGYPKDLIALYQERSEESVNDVRPDLIEKSRLLNCYALQISDCLSLARYFCNAFNPRLPCNYLHQISTIGIQRSNTGALINSISFG